MKRGRSLAFVAGLVLLITVLVFASLGTVSTECELCVQYNSQTECRRGSGADEQEAIQAATKAACAVMSTGMAASINCQNAPTTDVRCSN